MVCPKHALTWQHRSQLHAQTGNAGQYFGARIWHGAAQRAQQRLLLAQLGLETGNARGLSATQQYSSASGFGSAYNAD